MNTHTFDRPSATIYQFPLSARISRLAGRSGHAIETQAHAAYPDVAGGSWYHEAAIREADGTYKA